MALQLNPNSARHGRAYQLNLANDAHQASRGKSQRPASNSPSNLSSVKAD